MYYRARYYQPRLQRFVGEDPIGFRGGDLNLYAYVFNKPVRFNDPRGTDAWVGGEGTGMLHAGLSGFQGGGGALINLSTGEMCAYTIVCGRIGLGMLVGAGGKGMAQILAPRCGKDVGGYSVGLGADVIVPVPGFAGFGGSISGGGGLGGGVAAGPDIGAGISAGIDICYVQIRGCVNSPPDCRACSRK